MSIQLAVVDALMRLTIKRRFARRPDVLELRAIMKTTRPPRPPTGISLTQMQLGGVPADRLSPRSPRNRRTLLYIHGGGFVGGSPPNYRALVGHIAEKLNATAYVIDYRLAPEHPFPAALDDCAAAWRALLDMGIPAGDIVIAGDSAGGNLTLALALKLKSAGGPLPAALVALSPATDLADGTPSRTTNARADAMFDSHTFASVVRHYCSQSDPTDPLISPLRGDPTGLPPTLIQCSRDEMLRDDGVLMAEKMKATGVDITLELWPRVFHVWQLMLGFIPESRAAVENIVRFIERHWPAA